MAASDTLLLSAFEYHVPDTVLTFEAPFECVPDKGAGEAFESNGRAKRTSLGHGAADVLRPTWKVDLANPRLVAHSDRNGGPPTSAGRGGRCTIPLSVKRIGAGVSR